jgi:prepilin-type N-terminal cleavage/methylation domain-containing protein/prepilin-type processing-associated H-X9-DG protein
MKLPRPRSAFTLIELLTVIAIIGILAAILIPVVGAVRENARAAACVSNMRQIGTGILLYAEDHQGYAPPAQKPPGTAFDTWHAYIAPYVGFEGNPSQGIHWRAASQEVTIFHCPSSYREPMGYRGVLADRITTGALWWSYGLNTQVTVVQMGVSYTQAERGDPQMGAGFGLNMALLQTPSQTAAVVETTDYRARHNRTVTGNFGLAPHGGATNILFFDNSVRRYSAAEMIAMEPEPVLLLWGGR